MKELAGNQSNIERLVPPQITTGIASDDLSALSEKAREASVILKAFSHETRLMILCLLADGEKSVTQLEEAVLVPQATVSQQLARLRAAGLVETRRSGRVIYYSMAQRQVSDVLHQLNGLLSSPAKRQLCKR